jgi:nitroreductase
MNTLNTIELLEKPAHLPTTQISGAPLKPLVQVLLDRRATPHFKPDPIPDGYLEAILQLGAQAPSGYNLQPWRFLVVREPENRKRLQEAAYNQSKVGEAPVVLVAFGIEHEWKQHLDVVFDEGARRMKMDSSRVQQMKRTATTFLENNIAPEVWLNRHTMIALTTMMLAAEAYGLDTAPMEGFDPRAIKEKFGLPDQAHVVALLAIGFAQEPDKVYPGRLSLEDFVHVEEYNRRWTSNTARRLNAEIPGS